MHRYLALLAAGLLTTASPALAQVCMGVPMATGSTTALAGITFPDNANSFGIGVTHKATDEIAVGAEYSLTSYDDFLGTSVPSSHTFAVNGSYEIPLSQPGAEADIAVCPNAALGYTSWDEASAFAIPLGVSVGAAFAVAEGAALVAPYLNPQFVWARASADGVSDSETDFGFAVGANFIVSNLLFGANYLKVGDGDGTFGIRFGLMF